MALKTLENCDLDDPAQHFVWALINVPGIGKSGTAIPVTWAASISEHLVKLGFAWGPHLAKLADGNGMIHIDQLPKQTKKFKRPVRGEQSTFNNAATWVDMDEPEPEPIRIPDVQQLTAAERAAMVAQLVANGDIKLPEPEANYASVVGE